MSTLSLNHQWQTTYGTITMQSNGHSVTATNGCVKCKLEQMARRWSQGDLTVSSAVTTHRVSEKIPLASNGRKNAILYLGNLRVSFLVGEGRTKKGKTQY